MKTHVKAYYPVFLLLICSLSGCVKNDAPCTDPPREYPVPASASRWLLAPIVPGDSLKFKVYRKDKANGGKYIYLRDEHFYIKDTVIEKITTKNIWPDFNCNELMINDYLTAEITGSEPFKIKIDNNSITWLIIELQNKKFAEGVNQYLTKKYDWQDSIKINGFTFYDIKRCKGLDPFSNDYRDSTYSFYNLKYGPIKFIINDTLIYHRIIP
jgi:hypothetical protein